MSIFPHTTKKGFTLVEVLVAVAIITVITVVSVSLAVTSLSTITQAKEYIVATYLAQDAIEYVIAQKNDNLIDIEQGEAIEWKHVLEENCQVANSTSGERCMIHTTRLYTGGGTEIEACVNDICPPLNFDSATGMYQYEPVSATNNPTIYTREVWVEELESVPDELRVYVQVKWKYKNEDRLITLRTNIFNIK